MKNILVVLTGGTICSEERSLDNNESGKAGTDALSIRTISENAGKGLVSGFSASDSAFSSEVSFELSENFGFLSENMTIDKWNVLLEYFRDLYKGRGKRPVSDYDGIVIAHGTDTLAYSAAVFSLILKELQLPVIFVSANRPLGDKNTNGHENFRGAVELICRGIESGVYAVYKNPSDGKLLLHRGGLLTGCPDYSEDFHSCGEVDLTEISDETLPDIEAALPENPVETIDDFWENEKEDGTKPQDKFLENDQKLKNCVLILNPYPGLNYSVYDYGKFKAVFHRTYHAGTLCTDGKGKNSALTLVDCCKDGPDLWISPAKIKNGVYESVVELTKHAENCGVKVNFLYGYTAELVYAWLVIKYSA